MQFKLEKTVDGGTALKRVETQGNDTMTNDEQALWDQGYRPFEIYTYNDSPVIYYGELKKEGEISGWEIKHVFSTREKLKTYPFFDAVICIDSMVSVTETWHG